LKELEEEEEREYQDDHEPVDENIDYVLE